MTRRFEDDAEMPKETGQNPDWRRAATWEEFFDRIRRMIRGLAVTFTILGAVGMAMSLYRSVGGTGQDLLVISCVFLAAAASQWSIWFDAKKIRPKTK